MANRDINLFKAAGGDRAKGSKTSPMTYMVIFALVMLVAAVGVVAYFNMQANSVAQELKNKQTIMENYEQTKSVLTRSSGGNKSLAERYQEKKATLETAQAGDKVIADASALYPRATQSELTRVKSVLELRGLTVNDPEEGEKFVARNYETMRNELYDVMRGTPESDNYKYRGIFYSALGELADEQKRSAENVWLGYYRCYAVIVCDGNYSLEYLDGVIEELVTMENSPFLHVQVNVSADPENPSYETYIASSLRTYYVDEDDVAHNVLLIPMKSVVERVYDILEACARSKMNDAESEAEIAKYYYAITDVHFTNEELSFNLILDKKSHTTQEGFYLDYVTALDDGVFFDVHKGIYDDSYESEDGEYRSYKIILYYFGRQTVEQEA